MKITLTILGLVLSLSLMAQNNIGIGTAAPNPQAILDIESTDKGVLVSRLTTIARNTLGSALTNTEDGMLVYDKDLTSFFYWDGPNLQWVQVGTGSGDNWGTDVVNTSGANLTGDGTAANPLVVTDNDSDPNNEIELPSSANTGQVLSWDGTDWVAQNAAPGADNWGTDVVNTSGANLTGDGTAANPLVVTDNDSDPNNEIQDLSLNTSTNMLSLSNDPSAVNLNSFLDNTDNQNIAGSSFNGVTGNLVVGIQNGSSETIDLSILKGHDWYKGGTSTIPSTILEDIYTYGNVGIGLSQPTELLELSNGGIQLNQQNGIGFGGAYPYESLPTSGDAAKIYFDLVTDFTTNPNNDFLMIEKTDGNNPVPDGGIAFSMIGTGNVRQVPMLIFGDGRVGIGTTAPSTLLQVNGTASKPGGGAWTTTSDRRTKKDITDFSDGLDVLTKINPVTYKYNGLYNTPDNDTNYVGIIAQDVKEVAPYMIGAHQIEKSSDSKVKEEILNYDGGTYMLYILVNSVKEQQQYIKNLEKRLLEEQLKNSKEMEALKAEINQLKVSQ